jgi:hypothetical protein
MSGEGVFGKYTLMHEILRSHALERSSTVSDLTNAALHVNARMTAEAESGIYNAVLHPTTKTNKCAAVLSFLQN